MEATEACFAVETMFAWRDWEKPHQPRYPVSRQIQTVILVVHMLMEQSH